MSRARILGATFALSLVAGGLIGAAGSAAPVGGQERISFMGADGDPAPIGYDPSVAHNPRADQYLAVWAGAPGAEQEIWGRVLNGEGVPIGAQFKISDMGTDGSGAFRADDPAVAYNARTDEYLVVWQGEEDILPLVDDEVEIFAQRLTASGTEVGPNDVRISTMGPDGSDAYEAVEPAVAYNEVTGEYLVAWRGEDGTAPLVQGEYEIHAQRLAPDGTQVGPDDFRVSDMGTDGSISFEARRPSVAVNERSGEFLVTWAGDDNTSPLVNDEFEIFAQRLASDGSEAGVNDRRVSDMGPDGASTSDAVAASVVYNPATDEYLVAWQGTEPAPPRVVGEFEAYTQRLASDGSEVGVNDRRVSDMGTPGATQPGAFGPVVAAGWRSGEYLVAWWGSDDTAPLVEDEFEIFAQRLAIDGSEVGTDDARVSVTGADGSTEPAVGAPAVVYGSTRGEYLALWEANPNLAPLADFETEVFGGRIAAGPPSATTAAACAPAPPAVAPGGGSGNFTLSTGQLLINQRIDQAAVRRANGVQAWLDAGVEGRDLCQGGLGGEDLATGGVVGFTGIPQAVAPPSPRPVTVAAAKPADASGITLTVAQLFINQRISQAAIRRLNALDARIDGGLTGGDIENGTLTRAHLRPGLRVLVAPALVGSPTPSATVIARAKPGNPSALSLTVGQLKINQRISQAAVRRANALIARLGAGLRAGDIRDGSLTASDLAPGVALVVR